MVSPYVVHRHPQWWDDPDVFNPDRGRPDHPFASLAFGGGLRVCVGQNLARLESQIIVAKLVQRFRFSLVDPDQVKVHAGITLKPQDGIQMHVHRRRVSPSAQ